MLVHEWNDHALVERHRRAPAQQRVIIALLFHDTHHRSVTDPQSMAAYDLEHYDGVLAFGDVIRDLYLHAAAGQRGRGRGTKPPTRASSSRMPR